MSRILLFANTTWYLFNFRAALAVAARKEGHEVVFLSPYDAYVPGIEELGFRWIGLELTRRGLNPLAELKSVIGCASHLRRLRPDLLHNFTIKPVLYGSLAARVAGVPATVNSITGLGYAFVRSGVRGWLLRQLATGMYRWALRGERRKAIFENATDLATFGALGIVRQDQAVVIPGTGVNLDEFRPVPEPAGEPVIVMASRMLWDKGVGDLVEAARLLKHRRVEARILLVGAPDPGNPSSISEDQLRRWSGEGVVEWLGHRTNMGEVYSRSTIVTLPSHREGLPRTLVEAAACARPIVASDVPGCRDVVQHEVSGLLVPPGDPEALAGALQVLLSDAKLRRRMGAMGRRIVEEGLSDETIVRRTLSVYRDLLQEMKEPGF